MLLKALTLENFKGIREPVRIEFAPITLLFGPNNAGKSTIVHALMYAREVLEHNNCDVRKTKLGGDAVDLGGFINMVHGHDRNRVIRMRFELRLTNHLFKGDGYPRFIKGDPVYQLNEDETDWTHGGPAEDPIKVAASEFLIQRTDVWVEIKIAWHEELGPYVTTYAVGNHSNAYATIRYVPSSATSESESESESESNRTVSLELDFAYKGIGEPVEDDKIVDKLWSESIIEYESLKAANPVFFKSNERLDDKTLNRLLDVQQRDQLLPCNIMKYLAPLLMECEYESKIDQKIQINDASKADDSPKSITKLYLEKIKKILGSHEKTNKKDSTNRLGKCVEPDAGTEYKYFASWLWDILSSHYKTQFIPLQNQYPIPVVHRGSFSGSKTALPKWTEMIEIPWSLRAGIKIEKNHEHKLASEESYEYLRRLLSEIVITPGAWLVEELSRSAFLSAQRETPPRSYDPVENPGSSQWWNGRAAWDWLTTRDDSIIKHVNAWLNEAEHFDSHHHLELERTAGVNLNDLDVPQFKKGNFPDQESISLLSKRLSSPPIQRQLYLRNTYSGTRIAPCDVGSGLRQIVPIIVAAFVQRLRLCIIEEPEAKLHPGFQVVLADLLISTAVSRLTDKEIRRKLENEIAEIKTHLSDDAPDIEETVLVYMQGAAQTNAALRGNAEYDRWFLVETHSEYLLLRCLRRIRESVTYRKEKKRFVLRPEDIAVHFVESGENGTCIQKIRIDDDGEFLDPWPQGFFPERGREIFGDDS